MKTDFKKIIERNRINGKFKKTNILEYMKVLEFSSIPENFLFKQREKNQIMRLDFCKSKINEKGKDLKKEILCCPSRQSS